MHSFTQWTKVGDTQHLEDSVVQYLIQRYCKPLHEIHFMSASRPVFIFVVDFHYFLRQQNILYNIPSRDNEGLLLLLDYMCE